MRYWRGGQDTIEGDVCLAVNLDNGVRYFAKYLKIVCWVKNANSKVVNFLGVTFNLSTGIYRSYLSGLYSKMSIKI